MVWFKFGPHIAKWQILWKYVPFFTVYCQVFTVSVAHFIYLAWSNNHIFVTPTHVANCLFLVCWYQYFQIQRYNKQTLQPLSAHGPP